jgi:hypothetical protein
MAAFKRDSAELTAGLKRTNRLTDQAEAVAGIHKGLASMARGEGIPAEKAFERLRKKHNIPRSR